MMRKHVFFFVALLFPFAVMAHAPGENTLALTPSEVENAIEVLTRAVSDAEAEGWEVPPDHSELSLLNLLLIDAQDEALRDWEVLRVVVTYQGLKDGWLNADGAFQPSADLAYFIDLVHPGDAPVVLPFLGTLAELFRDLGISE